jgi:hypothetical protein
MSAAGRGLFLMAYSSKIQLRVLVSLRRLQELARFLSRPRLDFPLAGLGDMEQAGHVLRDQFLGDRPPAGAGFEPQATHGDTLIMRDSVTPGGGLFTMKIRQGIASDYCYLPTGQLW